MLTVVGFVLLRRAPRTSVRRATLALLAGWMLVTGLAFSFMQGIFHAYYTVALAPAIAGVVAIGCGQLWARRSAAWARAVAAAVVIVTGVTAFLILRLIAGWMPWLQTVVLALALVAGLMLVLPSRGRIMTAATASVAVGALLLAPAAYAVQTVATPHSGSIVTAGPNAAMPSFAANAGPPNGGPRPPRPPGGGTGGGMGGPGGQGFPGSVGPSTGVSMGSPGGLLEAGQVSDQLRELLSENSGSFTWAAAAIGSQRAAGYQLATQLAVMPLGGFNGSDPSPTLKQFQALVAADRIHYFIAGTVGRSNGGSSDAGRILQWVVHTYPMQQVGSIAVYDLSS